MSHQIFLYKGLAGLYFTRFVAQSHDMIRMILQADKFKFDSSVNEAAIQAVVKLESHVTPKHPVCLKS